MEQMEQRKPAALTPLIKTTATLMFNDRHRDSTVSVKGSCSPGSDVLKRSWASCSSLLPMPETGTSVEHIQSDRGPWTGQYRTVEVLEVAHEDKTHEDKAHEDNSPIKIKTCAVPCC